MDDLGQNYLDTGHYPEAIALYKDLHGPRQRRATSSCEYQSHITEATMAMKSGDKDAIVSELEQPVQALQRRTRPTTTRPTRSRSARTSTAALRDRDRDGVAPRGRRLRRASAAPATRRRWTSPPPSTRRWPTPGTRTEFSKFEFPRLVKEDWPTIYKIKYDMADLLYFRERWAECGPAFDAVVAGGPEGARGAPRPRTPRCSATRTSTSRSTRRASDKKGSGNLPGVGHRHQAGLGRQVPPEGDDRRPEGDGRSPSTGTFATSTRTRTTPTGRSSSSRSSTRAAASTSRRSTGKRRRPASSEIALRPLRQRLGDLRRAALPREHQRPHVPRRRRTAASCIDDMIADVPKFIDLFCTGDKSAKNEETVHAPHQGAVRHPAPPRAAHRRGGRQGRQQRARALREGRQARTSSSGTSTARRRSAATSRRSARSSTRSSRTRRAPSRPATSSRARSAPAWCSSTRQYRMDKSELAKDAMYKIGGNYQAIAVYDQASDWYERYAKENPHRKNADKALSDAIVLRLGLGQEDIAVADVKQYQKDYGNSNADGDRADRLRHRRALRRQGGLGQRAQGARGRDGDARQGAAGHPGAGARDARARAACTSRREKSAPGRVRQGPQALGRRQRGAGEDQRRLQGRGRGPARPPARQGARRRRRGDVLRRRGARSTTKVDSIPFPVYKGPGTKDDIKKYMDKTLKPWVAEEAGGDRGGRQGVPEDHRASAGAAAALGHRGRARAPASCGATSSTTSASAPYPKDWDKKGFVPGTGDTLSWTEVKANYLEHLDEASEPIKREQGEAGAQALPRRLGEVPVLRRVLARLREVAREELQDRIPRRRRAPRRAHAVERRSRRSPAAAHRRRPAVAPGRDAARHREGGGRASTPGQRHADAGKKTPRPRRRSRGARDDHEERSEAFWLRGCCVAAAGLGCGGGNKEAETPAHERRRRQPAASRPSSTQKAHEQFNAALDAFNGARQGERLERPDVRRRREAVRGAASAQPSGKFPEATYDAGLAYQRCGDDKDAKAHFQQALAGRSEVPLRPRAARALPVQGRRQRGRGDQRARAGRHRRELPERARARRPRDVPDAARLRQRRRELPREVRRQGRRPAGLRLREAEPAARARHRRRLHARVQPARALLLRQREEEGRRSGKKFGRTIATNAALAQARRRPAARARGARLLAGRAQEPELRADPQHVGAHPERARAGEHAR